MSFLIDKDIPNIFQLLETNDVVKIVAPTGSGKTLELPKKLSEKYSVIVVVSNHTNAEYLNSLNETSNLKYVSYLSFWMISTKLKSNTLILLDEVDMNSVDTFILISAWTMNHNLRKNKLVLTSNVENNLFPNFPTYFVKKYVNYSIEIRYTKDYLDFESSINDLISLVYNLHISNIYGDFLIFVLGKEVINMLMKRLQEINTNNDFEIIPIYLGMTLEDINNIYVKDINKLTRRIFVATDFAKTAFTLDNLACIFDTMREKKQTLTLTGGEEFTISYISKTDAKLRANRGGNTMPCIVYRMISERTYSLLDEYPQEVINRIPSHHLIIDIIEKVGAFYFENYPELEDTYKLMISYGLIDISNKLTNKAKRIRKLPFGLRIANLVYEWELNYPDDASMNILAHLLNNYSPDIFVFNQFGNKDKAVFEYGINRGEHIRKYFNRFRGLSDIETLLNIWIIMIEETGAIFQKKNLKRWCKENFINYEYLNHVADSVNMTKLYIDKDDLIFKLHPLIEKYYADKRYTLKENKTIVAEYLLNNSSFVVSQNTQIDTLSINKIEELRPVEIYSLLTYKVQDGNDDKDGGIFGISLSYVSPDVKLQKFQKNEILY